MIPSTKNSQRKDNAIDLTNVDEINDYFVSIGPKSSEKFIKRKTGINIGSNEKKADTSSNKWARGYKNLEGTEKQEKCS